jgi:putative hydrolase of the HAD superfamily
MRARPDLAHDVTALRRESLRLILGGLGYPESLADEGMAVFLRARNRVEPYPEVAMALKALAERYCLVSVTNGNTDLDQTPLRGVFHYSRPRPGWVPPSPTRPCFCAPWTLPVQSRRR